MAKVTKIPKDNFIVNLELTAKEARALHNVVRGVGGSPYNSARKYISCIEVAFNQAGVEPLYKDNENNKGSILFADDCNLD